MPKARPRWVESEKRWVYRITIDGRRRAFVSSTPGIAGKDECVDKADDELRGFTLAKNMRLKDAWELHLSDVASRFTKGYEAQTCKAARHYGDNYILPKLKHKKVKDITDQDWQSILNTAKRKKAYIGRTELSKKTIKNMRNEIMLFCKFAKKNNWIKFKPELEIPKKYEEIGKEILQPDMLVNFLLDTDKENKWTYLFAWQLSAVKGLRPGESLGIMESDLTNDTLTIGRSINFENDITKGKNKNAKRWSVLTEIDKVIIARQRAKKKKYGVISKWLFCQPDGSMPDHRQAYDQWRRYHTAHNFPLRCSPYSMRHTYTTYQLDKVKYAALQAELGHSSSMDTAGVYGNHEYDGQKAEIAQAINDRYASLVEKLRNIEES